MAKPVKPTRKGLPSSTGGSGPSHSVINKNEEIVRKMQMEKFKKFLKGSG